MSTTSAEILALTAQIKALTEGMRALANSQSSSIRDSYDYSQTLRNANRSLAELEDAFQQQTRSTTQQRRAQQELLKAKRDEIALIAKLNREHREAEKLLKDELKLREKLLAAQSSMDEAAEQAAQLELDNARQARRDSIRNRLDTRNSLRLARAEQERSNGLLGEFGGALGMVAKKLFTIVGALVSLGTAAISYQKTFMEAGTKSAGVIEATMGDFDGSLNSWIFKFNSLMGTNAGAVLEIMAQNRQAVNSLGGMTNAIDLTNDSVLSMRMFYGSLEDSLRGNIGILTSFTEKGVKPTKATLVAYNRDLEMLTKQTGKSAVVLNSMIDDIVGDTDALTILKSAREDERETILANQRALLKSNIALGMNAEQATNAAKMLNKLGSQKPLDRLKQAAKIRALGAAIGMGAEANQFATELSKTPNRQNKALMQSSGTALTNRLDQMGGSDMGSIFASALMGVTGTEEMFGTTSALSTTLAKTNEVTMEKLSTFYQSSADSIAVKVNNVKDVAEQLLTAATDGTLLMAGIGMGISELVKYAKPASDAVKEKWDRRSIMPGGPFFRFLANKIFGNSDPSSSPEVKDDPASTLRKLADDMKDKYTGKTKSDADKEAAQLADKKNTEEQTNKIKEMVSSLQQQGKSNDEIAAILQQSATSDKQRAEYADVLNTIFKTKLKPSTTSPTLLPNSDSGPNNYPSTPTNAPVKDNDPTIPRRQMELLDHINKEQRSQHQTFSNVHDTLKNIEKTLNLTLALRTMELDNKTWLAAVNKIVALPNTGNFQADYKSIQ